MSSTRVPRPPPHHTSSPSPSSVLLRPGGLANLPSATELRYGFAQTTTDNTHQKSAEREIQVNNYANNDDANNQTKSVKNDGPDGHNDDNDNSLHGVDVNDLKGKVDVSQEDRLCALEKSREREALTMQHEQYLTEAMQSLREEMSASLARCDGSDIETLKEQIAAEKSAIEARRRDQDVEANRRVLRQERLERILHRFALEEEMRRRHDHARALMIEERKHINKQRLHRETAKRLIAEEAAARQAAERDAKYLEELQKAADDAWTAMMTRIAEEERLRDLQRQEEERRAAEREREAREMEERARLEQADLADQLLQWNRMRAREAELDALLRDRHRTEMDTLDAEARLALEERILRRELEDLRLQNRIEERAVELYTNMIASHSTTLLQQFLRALWSAKMAHTRRRHFAAIFIQRNVKGWAARTKIDKKREEKKKMDAQPEAEKEKENVNDNKHEENATQRANQQHNDNDEALIIQRDGEGIPASHNHNNNTTLDATVLISSTMGMSLNVNLIEDE